MDAKTLQIMSKHHKNLIILFLHIYTFLHMIIPGLSEPPVRTLRATIPENESHIFR